MSSKSGAGQRPTARPCDREQGCAEHKRNFSAVLSQGRKVAGYRVSRLSANFRRCIKRISIAYDQALVLRRIRNPVRKAAQLVLRPALECGPFRYFAALVGCSSGTRATSTRGAASANFPRCFLFVRAMARGLSLNAKGRRMLAHPSGPFLTAHNRLSGQCVGSSIPNLAAPARPSLIVSLRRDRASSRPKFPTAN